VIRNAVLFLAALLPALTAGRAFWIWLGENPFNMSGQTYVEFFQQLDKRLVVPIAITRGRRNDPRRDFRCSSPKGTKGLLPPCARVRSRRLTSSCSGQRGC
jgi:hypothetical protein